MLYGPPCSGKSTVARGVLRHLDGVEYISAGSILRAEVLKDSPFGREISQAERTGPFPPRFAYQVMEKRLSASASGFILDGYPKHPGEVAEVMEIFLLHAIALTGIVHLELGLNEAINRGVDRLICSACENVYHASIHPPKDSGRCDSCNSILSTRPEDSPEVIAKRYHDYQTLTCPAMDQMQEINCGYHLKLDATDLSRVIAQVVLTENGQFI